MVSLQEKNVTVVLISDLSKTTIFFMLVSIYLDIMDISINFE